MSTLKSPGTGPLLFEIACGGQKTFLAASLLQISPRRKIAEILLMRGGSFVALVSKVQLMDGSGLEILACRVAAHDGRRQRAQ